jgi:O-methyltransferase
VACDHDELPGQIDFRDLMNIETEETASMGLKTALKATLRALRQAAGRFVILPPPPKSKQDTIIWKAAEILSAELVEGDYIEFGVYQGRSFIEAYQLTKEVYARYVGFSQEYRDRMSAAWHGMRFFAFDSFAGLPHSGPLDASPAFVEGTFVCDVDRFSANLRQVGIDTSKVVVVPGFYENTCRAETIATYQMKRAAVVHFDCDLYESTRTALRFIDPLLVDGTVLIFDDWFCFRGHPQLGEQRAFREWAAEKPEWVFTEFQKEGAWRNSFIANRKI